MARQAALLLDPAISFAQRFHLMSTDRCHSAVQDATTITQKALSAASLIEFADDTPAASSIRALRAPGGVSLIVNKTKVDIQRTLCLSNRASYVVPPGACHRMACEGVERRDVVHGVRS